MKTISLSLVLSAVVLPGALQAQPPVEKASPPSEEPRDGPPQKPNFDEMWKRVDTDGDGFASAQEFAALPRLAKLPEEKRMEIFKRLDKDSDGKLSRPEMEQMRRGGARMQGLKDLDTDKSGGISLEEFKAGETFKRMPAEKQENIFKRLDVDGDGQITPKDKPQRPHKFDGPPPTPAEIIQKGDANGDSALSFEEFRKDPHLAKLSEDEQEDRFEKLDKNKDQKITEDEILPLPPRPQKQGEEGRKPDSAEKPAESSKKD